MRAHLSVLLGLIFLVKAWGYYLGRFDLLTSPRGVVEGASYTDVHAQLPALNFLAIVAVICAILFLVNIRVRLWSLPGDRRRRARAGVGPARYGVPGVRAAVQRQAAGAAARDARTSRTTSRARARRSNSTRSTCPSVPPTRSSRPTRWRRTKPRSPTSGCGVPRVLKENFQSLQRIRQYYEFDDVDVDRYDLSGTRRVLMVSGREVTQDGIPTGGKTWQNTAPGLHARVRRGGRAGEHRVERGRAGVHAPRHPARRRAHDRASRGSTSASCNDVPFVVTNTGAKELDYEGASQEQDTVYSGTGGIPMGNFLQRALFAWRFKDINLLISGPHPSGQPDHDLPRPPGARAASPRRS